MTVKDLIAHLQQLPQELVVHVHGGDYSENRNPLNPSAVCVRKLGTDYTLGLVEGIFLE